MALSVQQVMSENSRAVSRPNEELIDNKLIPAGTTQASDKLPETIHTEPAEFCQIENLGINL